VGCINFLSSQFPEKGEEKGREAEGNFLLFQSGSLRGSPASGFPFQINEKCLMSYFLSIALKSFRLSGKKNSQSKHRGKSELRGWPKVCKL